MTSKLDIKADSKVTRKFNIESDITSDNKLDVESESKMTSKSDIESNMKSDHELESKMVSQSNIQSEIESVNKLNIESDNKFTNKSDLESNSKVTTKSDIYSNSKRIGNLDIELGGKTISQSNIESEIISNIKLDIESDNKMTSKSDIESNSKSDNELESKMLSQLNLESEIKSNKLNIESDNKVTSKADIELESKVTSKSNIESDSKLDTKSEKIERKTDISKDINATKENPLNKINILQDNLYELGNRIEKADCNEAYESIESFIIKETNANQFPNENKSTDNNENTIKSSTYKDIYLEKELVTNIGNNPSEKINSNKEIKENLSSKDDNIIIQNENDAEITEIINAMRRSEIKEKMHGKYVKSECEINFNMEHTLLISNDNNSIFKDVITNPTQINTNNDCSQTNLDEISKAIIINRTNNNNDDDNRELSELIIKNRNDNLQFPHKDLNELVKENKSNPNLTKDLLTNDKENSNYTSEIKVSQRSIETVVENNELSNNKNRESTAVNENTNLQLINNNKLDNISSSETSSEGVSIVKISEISENDQVGGNISNCNINEIITNESIIISSRFTTENNNMNTKDDYKPLENTNNNTGRKIFVRNGKHSKNFTKNLENDLQKKSNLGKVALLDIVDTEPTNHNLIIEYSNQSNVTETAELYLLKNNDNLENIDKLSINNALLCFQELFTDRDDIENEKLDFNYQNNEEIQNEICNPVSKNSDNKIIDNIPSNNDLKTTENFGFVNANRKTENDNKQSEIAISDDISNMPHSTIHNALTCFQELLTDRDDIENEKLDFNYQNNKNCNAVPKISDNEIINNIPSNDDLKMTENFGFVNPNRKTENDKFDSTISILNVNIVGEKSKSATGIKNLLDEYPNEIIERNTCNNIKIENRDLLILKSEESDGNQSDKINNETDKIANLQFQNDSPETKETFSEIISRKFNSNTDENKSDLNSNKTIENLVINNEINPENNLTNEDEQNEFIKFISTNQEKTLYDETKENINQTVSNESLNLVENDDKKLEDKKNKTRNVTNSDLLSVDNSQTKHNYNTESDENQINNTIESKSNINKCETDTNDTTGNLDFLNETEQNINKLSNRHLQKNNEFDFVESSSQNKTNEILLESPSEINENDYENKINDSICSVNSESKNKLFKINEEFLNNESNLMDNNKITFDNQTGISVQSDSNLNEKENKEIETLSPSQNNQVNNNLKPFVDDLNRENQSDNSQNLIDENKINFDILPENNPLLNQNLNVVEENKIVTNLTIGLNSESQNESVKNNQEMPNDKLDKEIDENKTVPLSQENQDNNNLKRSVEDLKSNQNIDSLNHSQNSTDENNLHLNILSESTALLNQNVLMENNQEIPNDKLNKEIDGNKTIPFSQESQDNNNLKRSVEDLKSINRNCDSLNNLPNSIDENETESSGIHSEISEQLNSILNNEKTKKYLPVNTTRSTCLLSSETENKSIVNDDINTKHSEANKINLDNILKENSKFDNEILSLEENKNSINSSKDLINISETIPTTCSGNESNSLSEQDKDSKIVESAKSEIDIAQQSNNLINNSMSETLSNNESMKLDLNNEIESIGDFSIMSKDLSDNKSRTMKDLIEKDNDIHKAISGDNDGNSLKVENSDLNDNESINLSVEDIISKRNTNLNLEIKEDCIERLINQNENKQSMNHGNSLINKEETNIEIAVENPEINDIDKLCGILPVKLSDGNSFTSSEMRDKFIGKDNPDFHNSDFDFESSSQLDLSREDQNDTSCSDLPSPVCQIDSEYSNNPFENQFDQKENKIILNKNAKSDNYVDNEVENKPESVENLTERNNFLIEDQSKNQKCYDFNNERIGDEFHTDVSKIKHENEHSIKFGLPDYKHSIIDPFKQQTENQSINNQPEISDSNEKLESRLCNKFKVELNDENELNLSGKCDSINSRNSNCSKSIKDETSSKTELSNYDECSSNLLSNFEESQNEDEVSKGLNKFQENEEKSNRLTECDNESDSFKVFESSLNATKYDENNLAVENNKSENDKECKTIQKSSYAEDSCFDNIIVKNNKKLNRKYENNSQLTNTGNVSETNSTSQIPIRNFYDSNRYEDSGEFELKINENEILHRSTIQRTSLTIFPKNEISYLKTRISRSFDIGDHKSDLFDKLNTEYLDSKPIGKDEELDNLKVSIPVSQFQNEETKCTEEIKSQYHCGCWKLLLLALLLALLIIALCIPHMPILTHCDNQYYHILQNINPFYIRRYVPV